MLLQPPSAGGRGIASGSANYGNDEEHKPPDAVSHLFPTTLCSPGPTVNVRLYGATGNGRTDDQRAIQLAADVASLRRGILYFPPGNYMHSGVIRLVNASAHGAGVSTVLTATNPAQSAIEVMNGAPVCVMNMVLRSPAGTTDLGTGESSAIYLLNDRRAIVSGVTIDAGFSQGILIAKSVGVTVLKNDISITFGEGVRVSGSINVLVSGNAVTATDASNLCRPIALDNVPYASGELGYVTVSSNRIYGTFFVGVDVETGHNCNVNYNQISEGMGDFAGIQVQGTDQVSLGQVSNILVKGNVVSSQFSMNGEIGIWCYDASLTTPSVFNVNIAQNTVQGNFEGIGASGNAVGPVTVNISQNTLQNVEYAALGASDSAVDVSFLSNIVQTCGGPAIYLSGGHFAGGNIGTWNCSNNVISNCSINSGTGVPGAPPCVIFVWSSLVGTYQALNITNNLYSGPQNLTVYFVESQVSGPPVIASGNNSGALMLPSLIPP